jgi:hypothetical protein
MSAVNPKFQINNTTTSLTLADIIGGFVTPEMFGAKRDGVTDDTAALNTALNNGAPVVLQAGIYNHTGLTLTKSNMKIVGAGAEATKLRCTSASATCLSGANLSNVALEDFSLTRSVAPSANANGLQLGSCSAMLIRRMKSIGHYYGYDLGPTDYSTVEDCYALLNSSHGVLMTNNAQGGTLQWYLINNLSANNGGYGFAALAGSFPGITQCTMGTWTGNATYGNVGCGLAFLGIGSCPIQGVRVIGGFYGQDGNHEIYLDTYGSQNVIKDAFIELPGTSPTGPTSATAASNVGSGVCASANVIDLSVAGSHINQCSNHGIQSSASDYTHVVSNTIRNNGQALTAGGRAGVLIAAGRLLLSGNAIGNGPNQTTQQYGLQSGIDGSQIACGVNDLQNNSSAPISCPTNMVNMTLFGNLPNTIPTQMPNGPVSIGAVNGINPGSLNVAGGIFKQGTAYSNP